MPVPEYMHDDKCEIAPLQPSHHHVSDGLSMLIPMAQRRKSMLLSVTSVSSTTTNAEIVRTLSDRYEVVMSRLTRGLLIMERNATTAHQSWELVRPRCREQKRGLYG